LINHPNAHPSNEAAVAVFGIVCQMHLHFKLFH